MKPPIQTIDEPENAIRRDRSVPRTSALAVWIVAAIIDSAALTAAPPRMVAGSIDGRSVTGLELVAAPNRRIVLGEDGWIHDFDPVESASEWRPVEGPFEPLGASSLRQQLRGEFGAEFEVVTTSHFVVVQPRGKGDRWPATFERLHRTFTTYFSVRGLRVRTGNFPMVAIVMPDRRSMHEELTRLGIPAGDVLGVYDSTSNRIVMYDHGDAFGAVASTICHEAAHQSAFNTGVHSRVAETPHWIVEGIGCLFQGPSFMLGRVGGTATERCALDLLEVYREIYQNDRPRLIRDLSSLIESDAMFRDAGSRRGAYALSWALTFYLSERQPRDFVSLLDTYGRRLPFITYAPAQRRDDFVDIVGATDEALATHLDRFLSGF